MKTPDWLCLATWTTLLAYPAAAQVVTVPSQKTAFIVGADLSVLPSTEKAGVMFSQDGKPEDVLRLLKRNGFNTIRIRLFHTPNRKRELVDDLDYVLPLAKRVKGAGFKLLLDFHYSDTWADPGKQFKPAAWESMNFEQLRGAIFEYTRSTLEAFKRAGAVPDIIQLGNEINTGMMWPEGHADKDDAGWDRLAQLIKAARRGARVALGPNSNTRFLHHIADPHHVVWHMDNYLKHDTLPDLIGVSYYPAWHGDLASFQQNMNAIAAKYNCPIVVVETAYPWTNQSFDTYPDVIHKSAAPEMPAHTPAGQAEFYRRLVANIKAMPKGRGAGFCVWEPAWLPSAKFGSPMDNMTLFDQNGHALPALSVISATTR